MNELIFGLTQPVQVISISSTVLELTRIPNSKKTNLNLVFEFQLHIFIMMRTKTVLRWLIGYTFLLAVTLCRVDAVLTYRYRPLGGELKFTKLPLQVSFIGLQIDNQSR